MKAYGQDLREWAGTANMENQLQLDWYDSHTDPEFLTDMKVKGNFITMFYPNRCTDILATCDGGLIKLLQGDFKKDIERELEEHFDKLTSTNHISCRIQRDFILRTYRDAKFQVFSNREIILEVS